MKLRLKENSIRLRLNQSEVTAVASGEVLRQDVVFPGDSRLSYLLRATQASGPSVSFESGVIEVCLPEVTIQHWFRVEDIGVYFHSPAGSSELHVAIEKDLECLDGPPGEYDPDAFPRLLRKSC